MLGWVESLYYPYEAIGSFLLWGTKISPNSMIFFSGTQFQTPVWPKHWYTRHYPVGTSWSVKKIQILRN